jgi:hypothetical protein
MHGSLVYSSTGITSASGVVNFGQHTSCVQVANLNSTTDAVIKLNGQYQILIPHTPNQSYGNYVEICGDYTTIEVITASCTIPVIAIG